MRLSNENESIAAKSGKQGLLFLVKKREEASSDDSIFIWRFEQLTLRQLETKPALYSIVCFF